MFAEIFCKYKRYSLENKQKTRKNAFFTEKYCFKGHFCLAERIFFVILHPNNKKNKK